MSRGTLQIVCLAFGTVLLVLQAKTGDSDYFIVSNIWLAASIVVSATGKKR